jgi:hypothetical protein
MSARSSFLTAYIEAAAMIHIPHHLNLEASFSTAEMLPKTDHSWSSKSQILRGELSDDSTRPEFRSAGRSRTQINKRASLALEQLSEAQKYTTEGIASWRAIQLMLWKTDQNSRFRANGLCI